MSILLHWKNTRAHSLKLANLMSVEDACAQSMPDASPIKWHLAHTTWFFETFILERFEPNFQAFHPLFRTLFNSYYNGIGEQYPRPRRGLLTRPSFDEVLHYRAQVDQRVEHLYQHGQSVELETLIELGIQHEQQHQELMLTDIKHLLFSNPLYPALLSSRESDGVDFVDHDDQPMHWCGFDAGLVDIGHHGAGFCFDNETPRHKAYVDAFELSSRLVTNGEYLEFIEAGGYRNPAWWLSDGWIWLREQGLQHPLYWVVDGNQKQEFTLYGLVDLDLQQPVCHLSYFEASAYAAWLGARLPTEEEWEMAAHISDPIHHLFACCWQWTSSSYAPYPGYTPLSGTVGEYNGKFMVNQYVLRGSSTFTPANHERVTYRNFFPATARWQRTGVRLAR